MARVALVHVISKPGVMLMYGQGLPACMSRLCLEYPWGMGSVCPEYLWCMPRVPLVCLMSKPGVLRRNVLSIAQSISGVCNVFASSITGVSSEYHWCRLMDLCRGSLGPGGTQGLCNEYPRSIGDVAAAS